MNTTDFCREYGITATSVRVDVNPNFLGEQNKFDHWKVTLKFSAPARGEKRASTVRMSTYFSKGFGHKGAEPKADEVLDCMVGDGYLGQTFEEFCDDFGYSDDSIKAKKTWQACQRNLLRLNKFLGDDLNDKLRDEVERL